MYRVLQSHVSVIFCSVDVLLVPPSVSVGVFHLFFDENAVSDYSVQQQLTNDLRNP